MIQELVTGGGWSTILVALVSAGSIVLALMPPRFRSRVAPTSRLALALAFIAGIGNFGAEFDTIMAGSYPGGIGLPLLLASITSLGPLVVATIGVAVRSIIEMVRPSPPTPNVEP